MTADDIKLLLNIDILNVSKDAYYDAMVPILLEVAEDKTNRDFSVTIPGGVKLFIARGIQYLDGVKSGIASKSIGDLSLSYVNNPMGLPNDIMGLLPRALVKFV
ncbi:MAG: hypothetical protein JJE03_07985 [Peptostreptococcaceae bacterium]|nr:hypothetical protein [Peptostreptococcaceae bacterium]